MSSDAPGGDLPATGRSPEGAPEPAPAGWGAGSLLRVRDRPASAMGRPCQSTPRVGRLGCAAGVRPARRPAPGPAFRSARRSALRPVGRSSAAGRRRLGSRPGHAGWAAPRCLEPPARPSGNGCLKACLIVGGIIVVLGIIGIIGISIFSIRFAEDLGVNPDGSIKACELITNEELGAALGGEAQAAPLGGLVDSTVGLVLDRRVLPDAPACWIVGSSAASATGRLARQDGGDASGDYQRARQDAEAGGYFAGDASRRR